MELEFWFLHWFIYMEKWDKTKIEENSLYKSLWIDLKGKRIERSKLCDFTGQYDKFKLNWYENERVKNAVKQNLK